MYTTTTDNLPVRFTKRIDLGQQVATFSYIERTGEDEYLVGTYTLPNAVLDYDAIVNAIVSDAYPQDKMQAVINNYLLDPSEADTKAEFEAMQAVRKKAKAYAKDLLQYVEANSLWRF